jgi:hypothetical protein
MMKAPLRPGTRPVGAAQLAVEDTSTDGPEFAATPGGWRPAAPRPARRCACKRGAVHVGAMIENSCPSSYPSLKAHVVAGIGWRGRRRRTTADRHAHRPAPSRHPYRLFAARQRRPNPVLPPVGRLAVLLSPPSSSPVSSSPVPLVPARPPASPDSPPSPASLPAAPPPGVAPLPGSGAGVPPRLTLSSSSRPSSPPSSSSLTVATPLRLATYLLTYHDQS